MLSFEKYMRNTNGTRFFFYMKHKMRLLWFVVCFKGIIPSVALNEIDVLLMNE